ncbi:hypothetical protein BSZ36_02150 [Rubricoccus marinus]|uniref:Glycosyl hydrolase family 13 catalytic domain-containing protein n=2 Tax=Rubricoccus marinus TaxID=716817 RepID=A0A259TVU6_9BACT|nr:hypothetical protein BSZ36_02150 [Rubricoccus marinus]
MFRFLLLAPLALLLAACAMPAPVAQTSPEAYAFTPLERAQGYALRGDTTVFVFDSALYGRAPERVAVTGAFRSWSDDMDDTAWALAPEASGGVDAGVWTLAVQNPEFSVVGAATPFKFRVDNGIWLDPPGAAPNVEGGNYVFMFGVTPPRLVAELRGERSVWVEITGEDLSRPTSPEAYTIVRWDGQRVPVTTAIPNEAHSVLLVPAGPLAANQVHYVEASVPGREQPLRGMARFDGLWRNMADGQPLGVTFQRPIGVPGADGAAPSPAPDYTTVFRLFAPRADSVHLLLYDDREGDARQRIEMDRSISGTWVHRADADLHGTWYDYAVYGPDGPGSHFFNQTGETVSDPYALVSDDSWGRARVWRDDFGAPEAFDKRPKMEDVVAYEVHLQDFTDTLPVASGVGPLEAFIAPGLTNARGEPIGLDYLERLGINTVHLMPVQEFLHYPDDAWQAAFGDDPFMQEQGIADENYQWGYRTTHALAVESRFRSAGDEPGAERQRFRDLVDALHARGMAVLIDVVFNHTGENMEGRQQLLTFNGIDKHYYYRLDPNGEHIGAFGNEVKSENRPMTQRWLLDQLKHFVEVFGVDGFRIDLAGQTDQQTLEWIQSELGEDVLIYGEPWIGSNDPDYEANPSWDWYKVDSPITFFQDDSRNAFKGSTADPTPAVTSRGFAGGDPLAREAAMRAIANDFPDEATPNTGINYLDIHDNWALADRFASNTSGENAWDGREGVREAEMRIAATLLMTSLGPVVMHGGTEIARSKGLAPLPEEIGGQQVLTEMSIAPIYIKGRGDTYNLRTANHFLWETVGEASGAVDFKAMEEWWKGLIALRMSDAGSVFRVGHKPQAGYVEFLAPEAHPQALGWLVGDYALVLVNAGDSPATFDFSDKLACHTWWLAASSDQAEMSVNREWQRTPSQRFRSKAAAPKSAQVWFRAAPCETYTLDDD